MTSDEKITMEETTPPELPPSEERLLDALAIEEAAKSITRPTALLQVQNLIDKIKRDAQALKRVERSKARMEAGTLSLPPESAVALQPEKAVQVAPVKDLSIRSEEDVLPHADPSVIVSSAISVKYTNIDRFAFDAGGYNSAFITLYIALPGVGSLDKSKISCNFTSVSFDLVVNDLQGKSHRLFKDNLEKEINKEKCKYIIKADKVVIKLAKVKGEYGSYDTWNQLTSKKKKDHSKSENPQDSIMDLMKDMYNSGDDNMRKMIGETMLKQRNGELDKGSMMNDKMDL